MLKLKTLDEHGFQWVRALYEKLLVGDVWMILESGLDRIACTPYLAKKDIDEWCATQLEACLTVLNTEDIIPFITDSNEATKVFVKATNVSPHTSTEWAVGLSRNCKEIIGDGGYANREVGNLFGYRMARVCAALLRCAIASKAEVAEMKMAFLLILKNFRDCKLTSRELFKAWWSDEWWGGMELDNNQWGIQEKANACLYWWVIEGSLEVYNNGANDKLFTESVITAGCDCLDLVQIFDLQDMSRALQILSNREYLSRIDVEVLRGFFPVVVDNDSRSSLYKDLEDYIKSKNSLGRYAKVNTWNKLIEVWTHIAGEDSLTHYTGRNLRKEEVRLDEEYEACSREQRRRYEEQRRDAEFNRRFPKSASRKHSGVYTIAGYKS